MYVICVDAFPVTKLMLPVQKCNTALCLVELFFVFQAASNDATPKKAVCRHFSGCFIVVLIPMELIVVFDSVNNVHS